MKMVWADETWRRLVYEFLLGGSAAREARWVALYGRGALCEGMGV